MRIMNKENSSFCSPKIYLVVKYKRIARSREGLVLQEQKTWEQLIDSNTVIGNASELFFVENDFDAFLQKIKNIVEE